MRVLIDTHVFIWWTTDPQKLFPRVYSLLIDPDTEALLSVVSIWEMQIKLSLDKLELKTALPELIEDEIDRNRIKLLQISLSHIYAIGDLPNHHRDPFDRLIIAQAKIERLTIVSIDEKFNGYDADRI